MIRHDKSGATALEFALVAPVVILLLLGLIEYGLIYFAQAALQGAVDSASRLGKSGYTTPGTPRETYIRNTVSQLTAGLLDPAKINISLLWYGSLSQVGQPEPCRVANCNASSPPGTYDDVNANGRWDADQGASGPGAGGTSVVYRVTYDWPVITPTVRAVAGATVRLSSTAVVRNELFQ